ncbi:hypothetical protein DOM21_15110 [Bacteriovorax stolpii]|uniref:hypothetical protein n=1 Tax=Bacteriovorax stolpii TaxID=960 RepID=UPI00115770AC|nr:hypothetical protein [Bacteriovorax stolpii]QDK42754.1 hypothetical protein DOM21_15110 [Bacteriovorax stolpii]
MKTLIATSLLLTIVSAFGYERPEDGPMTAKQADQLRNAVTVTITDVNERAFSKKAKAKYEAVLMNPFTRSITCDIDLTSTLKTEAIDSKKHVGIYAPARSGQKVTGEIDIKHGKKGEEDGLQWINAKGTAVTTSNCRFIDQ